MNVETFAAVFVHDDRRYVRKYDTAAQRKNAIERWHLLHGCFAEAIQVDLIERRKRAA